MVYYCRPTMQFVKSVHMRTVWNGLEWSTIVIHSQPLSLDFKKHTITHSMSLNDITASRPYLYWLGGILLCNRDRVAMHHCWLSVPWLGDADHRRESMPEQ